VTAPRSRRLELGTGLGVHLLEWGADDPALDHTVVLLHGFLDLAWAWAPTVAAGLAGRYHVVAPDFRGHGESDRVGAGGYYHFVDYLADLEDLLPRVARGTPSVVGHSMGGTVAGYYAGAFPDRVRRLALLEGMGPPEPGDEVASRIATWTRTWRVARTKPPPGYPTLADAAARLRKNDPLLDVPQALVLAERGTSEGADGRRYFRHDPVHLATGPLPFRVDVALGFWRRVACPVLLIEGGASTFRHGPEEQARRVAGFADARTVILEGAGHMMHRHQPAALAATLVEFLG
jgi:pimeloyl-ACP methyl ester carboxylesterase